ncbi:type II secretion system minor pseudopilin GspJ [Marinomonas sp. 2405UD68-3]|uniref:type II secretion system minor pseudopilin GspJ n=1 Tax=Marinomonas sp. 2405UD68-3 TaxID=3391835 RepID=UPI0039C99506
MGSRIKVLDNRYRSKQGSQKGFTLLELLIVLGILSFLGIASFNMAGTGVRLQKAIEKQSTALEEAVRVWQWIERDIEQIVPKTARDGLGEKQEALNLEETRFQLSKAGWQKPLLYIRSELQRVEYEWTDEKLIRRFWSVMDRDQDSKPIEQLFERITDVNISLLSQNGWQNRWPEETSSLRSDDTEPQRDDSIQAVKVSLNLIGIGRIERLFIVPTAIDSLTIDPANDNSSNDSQDEGEL